MVPIIKKAVKGLIRMWQAGCKLIYGPLSLKLLSLVLAFLSSGTGRINFDRVSAGSRRRSSSGFTLLETLVVIVIMAMMVGAISILYRSSSGSVLLRSTAQQIASSIRDTRVAALQSGRDKRVRIDLARRRFDFSSGIRSLQLEPGLAVRVTAAQGESRSQSEAGIRFFANGSSSGGTITLGFENQESTSSTDIYQIQVNWLTGRVLTFRGNQ